jgi:hypothetical protein
LVENLAHRKCWRYRHSSDPAHSSTYTFNRVTLLAFADALLAAADGDVALYDQAGLDATEADSLGKRGG